MLSITKTLTLLAVSTIFLSACTANREVNTTNQLENSTEEIARETEIKASFLIFTNGTKRDFTDKKYHNLNPEIYITSEKTTTIVAKANKTWADLFATLPMQLTSECLTTGTNQKFCNSKTQTLKFYINGLKEDSALSQKIKDGDKLLVSYGPEKDGENKLVQQILQVPNP